MKQISTLLKFRPGRGKSLLRKELAFLTVPILIETLLIMTLGAMDTFMLSRVGDDSVGAVGLANQVLSFCFLVFEVINLGTSVLCSQYLGARMKDRMETVVGVALAVNLIFGAAISGVLFFGAESILSAMGLHGEMLAIGTGYMQTVGSLAFVQAIAMTLSATLRANNKAYWPMIVILVVNVMNIFGNYALIFGRFGFPELGVQGAAISTVTARTIAMAALFVIVFKTTVERMPWHIFRRFPKDEFVKLMRIGLPSATEQMSYSCSQLVIAYFITTLGMESLAVRTYCVNIVMYGYLFCIAISQGGAIIIGHLVGAGKWNGAYVMGLYVVKRALGITLMLSLLLAVFGRGIMSLLTDNAEIITLGATILWIDVALECGRPVNIFAVNALRSVGDVNYPMYVGLIFMWSIAVGAAWWLGIGMGMGIVGMWWMFTLDENVRGIVFMRRWHSRKWMHKSFVTPRRLATA